ncbi:MAG: sugar phosphate isomerase/epimerase [Hungatella sp.]|nr:sugar phosphate isomerase/epimerase [Hungatella sp.]
MIRYSCHSENFLSPSPEEAFSFISALQFDCIDVASRSLIPQRMIAADPLKEACRFRDLSCRYHLPLSELFLSQVEVGGQPVSALSPMAHTKEFDSAFDIICLFAEKAGFASIMGGTGAMKPELGYERSFESMARTLKSQVSIAASHGLSFHVEPYRLSLLHTVWACLNMIQAVPGLRYTLDFLHFQFQGIPQAESMKLIPWAGHIHARQAKTGIGKCDFSEGEIDYESIVQELKRNNWSGDIAMEFWCSEELSQAGIQAVEQNILMRYHLKRLFR